MIAERAFRDLFPEKDEVFSFSLRYSGHFKGFNAGVRRVNNDVCFSLSRNWRSVDEDIKIGLLQSLLCRMFKSKKKTLNIDLYNNFLRSVHVSIPKTKSHPVLEESFNRVNAMFFNNSMEMPNLVLGKGVNKLGHYDYGSDAISITEKLLPYADLLDYVMYHEMLHKKHKFNCSSGRTVHHSKEFRDDEARFPNASLLEKELQRLVSRKNIKKGFFGWLLPKSF